MDINKVPVAIQAYSVQLTNPHMDETSKENYYNMLVATRDFCAAIIREYDEKTRKKSNKQHATRRKPK